MDIPIDSALQPSTKSLRRRYIEARESKIPTSQLREALATVKPYVQQQWDPGMLSLAFEAVDETAVAVQQDLHNLERHLATRQLRRPQRQAPITSYFQPSSSSSAAERGIEM